MKRWNGWGDEATTYPLPDSGRPLPGGFGGRRVHLQDASLEQAILAVPSSALAAHPLISTDPEERLRHAAWAIAAGLDRAALGPDPGLSGRRGPTRLPTIRCATCWITPERPA